MVTNRAGATVLPGAAYDGFVDRGESENRNKELKTGLLADRLSDHRYFANLFRLYPKRPAVWSRGKTSSAYCLMGLLVGGRQAAVARATA